MQLVTIACPVSRYDESIDVETAPIWQDDKGKLYYVASGALEGLYETSEPVLAIPTRINVVVGVDGLTALAMMGLSLKEVESNA